MNRRTLTARLDSIDIEKLNTAQVLASRMERPLNTYVCFAPRTSPRDAADAFVALRKQLAMWVSRHCASTLTGFWYVTASDDGTSPELRYFIHLPNYDLLAELGEALKANYPGENIVHVTADVPFYSRSLTGPFVGRRSGMTRNIHRNSIKKTPTPQHTVDSDRNLGI